MQVASETIELPRAMASAHAWQAPASGCSHSLSGPARTIEEEGTGIADLPRNGSLLRVLEGYQLEYSEVDVVLHYDLPDSRQWKKRVWPHKSHPKKLFRWNTTEEILSYLISFDHHDEWISTTVPHKPPSGSILFFHRKQTKRYRDDGYEWKTRKTTKTVREDRMKLKVGGYQLLYGCYAHSASNPNFHRRSYWLIQNPDLIMVHYLELDCSDGFGERISPNPQARQNSMVDLEQSIEPSSWSLLTISDCNLCALLSMVHTSESTKSLLSQLTAVLDQNIQRALTLEEAIEMNNNGLPEDMFKDTRSRKMKIGNSTAVSGGNSSNISSSSNIGNGGGSNKKKDLQAAMSYLSSDSQGGGGGGESSKMAMDCGSVSAGTYSNSMPNASTPTTTTNMSTTAVPVPVSTPPTSTVSIDSTQKALDVLSKSAHIIVCCQKAGSLSYILTVPTSTANNSTSSSTATPPVPTPATPIPTPGRRILPSPANGAESSSGSSSILNKLSGLVKRTSEKCGKGSSPKMAVKTPAQGESSGKMTSVPATDYDLEKFSNFANILVNMDGIEGFQAEGCDSCNEEVPGNHLNQQQLRQLVPSRLQLLTSSGSDAEFTDSLESEGSVSKQVEYPRDKVMDFASIVSNAVGSNSDQMIVVKSSDHTDSADSVLPLLPEVPMSWLKIPTSTELLNGHPQTTSESMETTESEQDISSMHTLAISRDTSPATASISTTASNDVRDVQIANKLLSSPSGSHSTSDLTPRPPPPRSNGENHSTNSHQSAMVGTQVHAHSNNIVDQPMAESEPRNNSSSSGTSDDFLNVSLDLDAESLQQLLALSRSPESHHSSNQNQQKPSHLTITCTTDTAQPLSPISQLFDRLEPAGGASSPGRAQRDSADSYLSNAIHAHDQRFTNENPSHSHTDFNGHTHHNVNVDAQPSIAINHENRTLSAINSSQVEEVSGLTQGNVGDISSTWTPSPNSLQLWLESTSGAFGDGILPSMSSESTTTVVAESDAVPHNHHLQPQAMEVDDNSELTAVDLPQDLCEFLSQSSELPHQSNASSAVQVQSTHAMQSAHLSPLHGSILSFEGRDGFHSSSGNVSNHDFSLAHQSDPNHGATLYDSTEHFPGPFDEFCAHPDPSIGSYPDGMSAHAQVQRKISNTSISSEPLSFDSLRVPPTMYGASDSSCHHHHLSLPNLTNLDAANDQGSSSPSLLETSQIGSPIQSGSGGFTSSPCSHRSISPGVVLPDIPEGVQMHSPMTQFDPNQFSMDLLQYRTSSSVPSSPSIASVSSRSTVSTHEFFENESPSVVELCELLSESPNVRHQDFSHLVLSESEQQQLFHSAQVIQNAFRKYKSRRQTHDKEKSAALLIENCYKNYVQMKREKDRAARRIQQQYRIYKSRTKELNRAAVFIQQMYRYQKHRKVPPGGSSAASASQSTATLPPPPDPT